MASPAILPEASRRLLSPEALRSAAKQSQGILVVPVRLRRAIKLYLKERRRPHLKRSVLQLSQSLDKLKVKNLLVSEAASRILVEDPARPTHVFSGRWKVRSAYGDLGLKYGEDQSMAYVLSRMPAVFSACHRVLREIRRRVPDFSPGKVLDFGAGPGTAMWAVRKVWPHSLEEINIVEPSQDMQRAGKDLLKGVKTLPLIQSYDSLQSLSKNLNIKKQGRKHDLVISSYALGEIPSVRDRIIVVRQLWELTRDVLVLIEPGTPDGFKNISLMRSHILWMEKRKSWKSRTRTKSSDILNIPDKSIIKNGAFVIAPCPHDGRCPLENTDKYCHFVQRLQRTSIQRVYKRTGGEALRGYEDEKFCFVALRRGERPREAWPLDGMKFPSLKKLKEARSIFKEEQANDGEVESEVDEQTPLKNGLVRYASDNSEAETDDDLVEASKGGEISADVGGGWGRIVFPPVRRGNLVEMDVCRSTNPDCSEGAFERVVLTRNANPSLHLQARKSLWGDLWPCGGDVKSGGRKRSP